MSALRSWSRRGALAGVGLLVLLGAWLLGAPDEDLLIPGSTASSFADGRRVAFELLREVGLEPEVWRQAPLALPEGEHLLWLAAAPFGESGAGSELLAEEPDRDLEVDPALADPRHPWNYARFVEQGGTLVLPARVENLEWLADALEIELPPWNGVRRGAALQTLTLESGERLVVTATSEEGSGEEGEYDARWHDLAVIDDGRPFASWTTVGLGRVALLADDSFLRNDTIGKRDDGLLLVRLVEALDHGGRLLFDEYALGRWAPPSSSSLLLAPGLREVTLSLVLLVLCAVLSAAWAREFPRDPELLPANPRVRATAQGRLLERARRFDLCAEGFRLGVLRRLARHFKRTRAAAALREGSDAEEVAEVARELARLAGRPAEIWERLFVSAEVRSRQGLAELAASLEQLERELIVHGRASARGAKRRR